MDSKEKVKLLAKARKLGIEGARGMSTDELVSAVESAGDNGTQSVSKAKAVVQKAVVKKSASVKKSPVKAKVSPVKKTAVKKSAPAKSKSATKKTVAKGAEVKRPSTKPKETVAKTSDGTFYNHVRHGKYSPRANYNITATKTIRNFTPSDVDYDAEWTGGRDGVRAEVFKVVRKYKGNRNKIFTALAPRAQEFFGKSSRTGKKRTKDESLRYLRWYISRLIFDFLVNTGQHKPSQRTAHARTAVSPSKPKGVKKSTKSTAGPQKGSQAVSRPSKKAAPKATGGKRGRPVGFKVSEETKAKAAATRKKNARAKARVAAKAAA